jgi:hypothetical protein
MLKQADRKMLGRCEERQTDRARPGNAAVGKYGFCLGYVARRGHGGFVG